jgi:hypothetical protein
MPPRSQGEDKPPREDCRGWQNLVWSYLGMWSKLTSPRAQRDDLRPRVSCNRTWMRSLNRHPAIPEPSWKYLVAASSKKDDVRLHSVYERPRDEVIRASDRRASPKDPKNIIIHARYTSWMPFSSFRQSTHLRLRALKVGPDARLRDIVLRCNSHFRSAMLGAHRRLGCRAEAWRNRSSAGAYSAPSVVSTGIELLLQPVQHFIARQHLGDARVRLTSFANCGKELAVLELDPIH